MSPALGFTDVPTRLRSCPRGEIFIFCDSKEKTGKGALVTGLCCAGVGAVLLIIGVVAWSSANSSMTEQLVKDYYNDMALWTKEDSQRFQATVCSFPQRSLEGRQHCSWLLQGFGLSSPRTQASYTQRLGLRHWITL